MKTAIIGSGGVGGYFGGRMAFAGGDVTFLARGEHGEAMRSQGLKVKSIQGDFHVPEVKVAEKIGDMQPSDLILVCVKAWQIKELRNQIASLVHQDTIIIPLQNGILAVDELAEAIDRRHLLPGLCRIISKLEAPGVINHFGVNPIIVFGEADHSVTPRLQQLKSFFDGAGVNCQVSQDMDAELWKKFIAICLSGLLAVTRTTYGELRELKETRQMMVDVIKENYILARKKGVNIEPEFVDKTISFVDTFPYDSTSSLTRDVWEGKPSEIFYQNGTSVRLGEELGVDTPVNRFIFNCILPGELKVRKMGLV